MHDTDHHSTSCTPTNRDELRSITLFDGLSDQQLIELTDAATVIAFSTGDQLFHEAEPAGR